MWVLLKKHNLEREIAKRPNYFKMWDTAEKLHLDKFIITFNHRTGLEQDAKESIWKK